MKTLVHGIENIPEETRVLEEEARQWYNDATGYVLSKVGSKSQKYNAWLEHLKLKDVFILTDLKRFGSALHGNIRHLNSSVEFILHKVADSTFDNLPIYVSMTRIDELNDVKNRWFDTSKLILMLKELNLAYKSKCYYSVAMLLRAIIDHIPPIFGVKSFSEVANNYKGEKSIKDQMKKLDTSLRKIADRFLHAHIKKIEVHPTETQVNFTQDLDVLLGEIVKILHSKNSH